MAAAGPGTAEAVPDWRERTTSGSLTVCPDKTRPNRFYYAPPEIALATTADGRPDFHFLMTRYTGSAVSSDRGVVQHRSLVTFRVRLPRVPAADLERAARDLGRGAPVELRPLPIRKLATTLVYATIGGDTTSLPPGRFETAEGAEGATDAYWTERIYSIGLDSLTAQAFRSALEKDQVYLSLGYAFLGDVIADPDSAGTLSGTPSMVEELKRQSGAPDGAKADSARLTVLRAGAISIGLDVKRFPDLMRQVDLNDRAPPGYAALDVYCYDFQNELRPDLAEKQVEIDAESVSGKRVRLLVAFRRDQSDLYSASVRFPVAVRLDRSYRYRVREVKTDGMDRSGAWREVASWSRILDVTTPRKEAGVRSVLGP